MSRGSVRREGPECKAQGAGKGRAPAPARAIPFHACRQIRTACWRGSLSAPFWPSRFAVCSLRGGIADGVHDPVSRPVRSGAVFDGPVCANRHGLIWPSPSPPAYICRGPNFAPAPVLSTIACGALANAVSHAWRVMRDRCCFPFSVTHGHAGYPLRQYWPGSPARACAFCGDGLVRCASAQSSFHDDAGGSMRPHLNAGSCGAHPRRARQHRSPCPVFPTPPASPRPHEFAC